MESILLVVLVIVVVVVLEMIGLRLYRRHRARKQAAFTREGIGECYEDLQYARAWCLASKNVYESLACRANDLGRSEDRVLLEAMGSGERSHLAAIEKFRSRLRTDAVKPDFFSVADLSYSDALREVAERSNAWNKEFCVDATTRAHLSGYKDLMDLYKQLGEVEQDYARICVNLDERSSPCQELSRCPSCGVIAEGRRPAFCVVCARPGFEFEEITFLG